MTPSYLKAMSFPKSAAQSQVLIKFIYWVALKTKKNKKTEANVTVVFNPYLLHCNVILISNSWWFLGDECRNQGTLRELLLFLRPILVDILILIWFRTWLNLFSSTDLPVMEFEIQGLESKGPGGLSLTSPLLISGVVPVTSSSIVFSKFERTL